MNCLNEVSKKIISILGEQKVIEADYRLINYTVNYKKDDLVYLLNNLTTQIIVLSSADYNRLNNGVKYDAKLDDLIKSWFLVPVDFDEYNLLSSVRTVLKALSGTQFYNHYTIFTTTDCNANCFYCFEKGKKRESMSENVALDLA